MIVVNRGRNGRNNSGKGEKYNKDKLYIYIYEGKIVTRDKHKVELRETKLKKRINC